MDLLLYPNQLFHVDVLTSVLNKYDIHTVHFIEDPLFYGKRKGSGAVSKLSLNQLRILYMRVVHQSYVNCLKKTYKKVHYYPIDSDPPYEHLKHISSSILYIDPCDQLLESKLQKIFTNATLVRVNSPSFFESRDDLDAYASNRHGKQLQHSHFYEYMKAKYHILENTKSMDQMNRVPYSKNIPEPRSPLQHIFSTKNIWEDTLKWLEKSPFKNNPKPLLSWDTIISDYLTKLPITPNDAKVWMKDFFTQRFHHYGKYQDVIIDTNPLLYHSSLSIFINNGFLTPHEVVQYATMTYRNVSASSLHITDSEHLANYEGFVRQILGWREYTRYYYYHVPKSIYRKNVFRQSKNTLTKAWYDGTVGIPILDKTIQYAMNYGYINHIQRLMVVSNFMTLNNYHPNMVYKWMYEFSLDSYEWVMVFNCYSMGSWSDHGHAMRKPYISSANYLLRMSNEQKGIWIEKWNTAYKSFLQKNKTILKHTYLANQLYN